MTMPASARPIPEPALSIIIPVLNETERINELISHIRTVDRGGLIEIVIVDGDQSGSTISAVRDKNVRTLVAEKGRARQMNSGAAVARGGILLFLHADTLLPADAVRLTLSRLEDRSIVAGAFDLGFQTTRKIFKLTELYVFLRTRLTRVPFGDQAIFIRREYFTEIGGYRNIPLMEDVDLMKRIKKQGHRIVIIPEKALTSPRRYEDEGIVYCTFRNWLVQFLYSLGVPPDRLVKWYK